MIYGITERFPGKERHRLTDQTCRAALSIPSNITEGCGRRRAPELAAHSFAIAKGSASELERQLILANDLGYLNEVEFQEARHSVEEIQKMLSSFIARLIPHPRR